MDNSLHPSHWYSDEGGGGVVTAEVSELGILDPSRGRPPAQALIMSLSNYRRALAGYGTSSPDPRGNWARTCSTSGPGDTYFPDIAEHGELSAWIEVKWKKSHTRSSPRDHETPHSYVRTRRSARPQTVSSPDRHLFSTQRDS